MFRKVRKDRKVRKTRRTRRTRRYKGGGKLDRLPILGTTADEMFEDLKTRWEFVLLMAHGKLAPGLATVPKNTYLLFNSPAGCQSLVIAGIPFRDVFVAPDRDTFLRGILHSHITNTAVLNTTTPDIRSALSLDACYSPDFFSNTSQFARTAGSSRLTPEQRKRTIYGPGEQVNDMILTFANQPFTYLYLGVFDLPIPEFYDRSVIGRITLENIRDYETHQQMKRDGASPESIAAFEEKVAKKLRAFDQGIFASATLLNKNWYPEYITPITSKQELLDGKADQRLSTVLDKMLPVPDGKVRLLYVGACRGIECQPLELRESLSRFARRGSLTGSPYESSIGLEATKSLQKPV